MVNLSFKSLHFFICYIIISMGLLSCNSDTNSQPQSIATQSAATTNSVAQTVEPTATFVQFFFFPPDAQAAAKVEINKTLHRLGEYMRTHNHTTSPQDAISIENPMLLQTLSTANQNAHIVPFKTYEYVLYDTSQAEFTMIEDRQIWFNLRILIQYTLEGVPDTTFSKAVTGSFIKNADDDGWLALTLEQESELFWDSEEVAFEETTHFLLFYYPRWASPTQLSFLETNLEAAYHTLEADGPLPLADRYVVYLAPDNNAINRLANQNTSSFVFATAVSSSRWGENSIETDSPVLYLNQTKVGTTAPAEWLTFLRHELVHLSFTKYTMPYMAPWIAEGAGTYFGGDDFTAEISRFQANGDLIAVDLADLTHAMSLDVHNGSQLTIEYAYVYLLTRYLIETYGQETYLDFYRSYKDIDIAQLLENSPLRYNSLTAYQQSLMAMRLWVAQQQVPQYFEISLEALETNFEAWLTETTF